MEWEETKGKRKKLIYGEQESIIEHSEGTTLLKNRRWK